MTMKINVLQKGLKVMVSVFFFSLVSCGQEKVHIDDDIIKIIESTYKDGDILVFQNTNTKEKDTSFITKKEIYHDNYDWFRHDGYQPHQAKVWYKNKKLRYGLEGDDTIISSEKRKPDDKDWLGISYLRSSFYMEKEDLKRTSTITLKLVPKTFTKVYIPKPNFKSKKGFSPKVLYWDRDYGIIKYETYGGDVWERINW